MSVSPWESKLRETLALAQVGAGKVSVISHGQTDSEIGAVHRDTNLLIKDCLDKNSLCECVHVAGEMRALTDPFHRSLCEEINRRDQRVFRVVFFLPSLETQDTATLLETNLSGWADDDGPGKWYDSLRTIYSIANRSVELFAVDTPNEVQYSVFGGKYVLIQEKHKDRARQKHTWLIDSESISSDLLTIADGKIGVSKQIDEGNYRRFTRNLTGTTSRRLLSVLMKTPTSRSEDLLNDPIATDFCESTEETLRSLEIMGFVQLLGSGAVQISPSGKDFANAPL